MDKLRSLVVFFSLITALLSQAPNPPVHIGVPLRTQYGGPQLKQIVSVVAESHSALPIASTLGNVARVGGTIYLHSTALDTLPVPKFQAPGDSAHWFSMCWTDNVIHPIQEAVPGHNLIFGTPPFLTPASFSHEWLGPSPWLVNSPLSPPEGWIAFFLCVPIPANYALQGVSVSVQSYRYDYDGFFISDEVIFLIG